MKNKFIKLMSTLLIATIFVSFTLPEVSHAASPSYIKTNNTENQNTENQNTEKQNTENQNIYSSELKATKDNNAINTANVSIQPMGIKSFLIKLAAKSVASDIRAGGWAFDKILSVISRGTATQFRKHANYIASKIDQFAEIPDVTSNIIKSKLFYALKPIMGGTYAEGIADAVYWVINILVL